ncbi:MAG: hypothetical protein R3B90_03015 [Planctomycetaceae bacterium]
MISNTAKNAGGSRVGFGTDAPDASVHVVDQSVTAIRVEEITSPSVWDLTANTTGFHLIDQKSENTPFSILSGAPTGKLILHDNGDATLGSLTVRSNGDVGIGDTTPDADFELERSSGDAILRIQSDPNNTANNIDNPFVRFAMDGNTVTSIIGQNQSNNPTFSLLTGATQDSMVIGTEQVNHLHFGTNGSVRMTLRSNGDFGIGTVDPVSALHVWTAHFPWRLWSGSQRSPTASTTLPACRRV